MWEERYIGVFQPADEVLMQQRTIRAEQAGQLRLAEVVLTCAEQVVHGLCVFHAQEGAVRFQLGYAVDHVMV